MSKASREWKAELRENNRLLEEYPGSPRMRRKDMSLKAYQRTCKEIKRMRRKTRRVSDNLVSYYRGNMNLKRALMKSGPDMRTLLKVLSGGRLL